MPSGRRFDCKICLNRYFDGKCKSLLHPPAGNTCGWYAPPPDAHGEDLQIRTLTAGVASSFHRELSDVFPGMSLSDWIGIIGCIPSTRRASGASLHRRIRGVTTDEMVVSCSDCGFDMDVDDFVERVRGGRPAICLRCGSRDISPSSV